VEEWIYFEKIEKARNKSTVEMEEDDAYEKERKMKDSGGRNTEEKMSSV